MADITKFVNASLKEGNNFDVYLNRFPKIGSGKANVLQPLRASLYVDASIIGVAIKGNIDIVMPDLGPSGTCQISFLGNPGIGAYHTEGDRLLINVGGRTVTFYAGDKAWSWIDASGVPGSVGVWPAGKKLARAREADLAAPAHA